MKQLRAVLPLAFLVILAACAPRTTTPDAPRVENYNSRFNLTVNDQPVPFQGEAWVLERQPYTLSVSFSNPESTSFLDEDARDPLGFFVELQNKSQTPIRIIWEESSYIDSEGNAERLYVRDLVDDVLNPKTSEQRNMPQSPTVVPPGAGVREAIAPSDYVFDISGNIVNVPVISAETIAEGQARQGLYLTFNVGGQPQALSLTFQQKN